MEILRVGPGGLLLAEALLVSGLIAILTWRKVRLAAGIPATLALAVALALWQALLPDTNPALRVRVVAASFVVVPSLLLLGASRLRWIARHAWVFVLIGPVAFVGCYVGICELCVKAGLI